MMTQQKSFAGSKILLSFGLIIVSVAYSVWQHVGGQQSAATPAQEFKSANDAFLQTLIKIESAPPAVGLPEGSSPMSQPMMNKPTHVSGLYIDGSYTGSPMDAYYGTVQVKAVVRNSRVVDVQFLRYPNDRGTSRYINGQAMPLLTQEAIQAQSAQVDGVSGATFTSQAFKESLASAFAHAKN